LVVAVAVPITVRLLGDKAGRNDAAAPPPPSASTLAAPACGFADEFDAPALDPAWSRTRADTRLTLAGGAADLDAPEGSDIYTGFMTAPRLLRPITGDFVLEATLEAAPAVFYQAAGLLLWVGPESYVRVERGFGGHYGTLAFEYRDGGLHQRVHGPLPNQKPVRADATRVVLRMTRTGGTVAAAWRPADRAAFADLGSAKLTLPPTVSVGVSVLNRAQFGAKPTPFHARVERVAVSC
jgi:hypothetical protein